MSKSVCEKNAEINRHTGVAGYVCIVTAREAIDNGLISPNGIGRDEAYRIDNCLPRMAFMKFYTLDGKWHKSIATGVYDRADFMQGSLHSLHHGFSLEKITSITPSEMATIEKDREECVSTIREAYEKEYGDL